jgi:threonine/homoserine/homoserine lactone efflux protein
MAIEWLFPLAGFAWVTCITPGPNNVLLTASGARFGFRRTLPHVLGISAGMGVMLMLVALGLGALFQQWPVLQTVLRVLGSGYLLWLGYLIARSAPLHTSNPEAAAGTQTPWAIHQALFFQFVNPKAWLMSISAIGSFTLLGHDYWLSVGLLIGVFCLICLKTCLVWAQFGVQVGRWLRSPLAWQRFNRVMGLLTAACVVMIWR